MHVLGCFVHLFIESLFSFGLHVLSCIVDAPILISIAIYICSQSDPFASSCGLFTFQPYHNPPLPSHHHQLLRRWHLRHRRQRPHHDQPARPHRQCPPTQSWRPIRPKTASVPGKRWPWPPRNASARRVGRPGRIRSALTTNGRSWNRSGTPTATWDGGRRWCRGSDDNGGTDGGWPR